MPDSAFQQCVMPACKARFDIDDVRYDCEKCGGLLDVAYDWDRCPVPSSFSEFISRRTTPRRTLESRANSSGVWRFRELMPFAPLEDLVTIGEGQTVLQQADALASRVGVKPGCLFLQYEGFNPSGSFKDNGMAAAFTTARRLGKRRVACASTGNTSASLALFAHLTSTAGGEPMEAIVFVGSGKIALGKLAQALDFGARTIRIQGDFDACMKLVRESADRLGLYLMNSVNPFRIEGQKAIIYRVIEGLDGETPDWIIVPGGNLGNSSAFGKAFIELRELGLVSRVPRLAIINATGANTLFELYNEHGLRFHGGAVDLQTIDSHFDRMNSEGRRARTVASAIEIGQPVNLIKALRSLEAMDGVVRQVPDEAILDGKALVGRYGYGCEPAGGASIAGLRALLAEQVISRSDRVVCILTGHSLKDPNATVDYHDQGRNNTPQRALANPPVDAPADLDAIIAMLQR